MKRILKIILFSIFAVGTTTGHTKDLVCSAADTNTALIVIDMQSYYVKRNQPVGGVLSGYFDNRLNKNDNDKKIQKLLETQIAVINKIKEANLPIAFLEYKCDSCDSTYNELKSAVANYANVRFFKKSTDGMFDYNNQYRNELIAFLNNNSVGKLIITGANGSTCVLQSILGALQNNCGVIALSSAIADFNFSNYIYPYAGQYTNIKPSCKDCIFSEIATIEELINFIRK